jgi:hypothetical protein
MESLILIGAVAFGIWYWWGKRQVQISRARQAISAIPGYVPAHVLIGTDGAAVGLDSSTKRIAFVDQSGAFTVCKFRDVLAAEVCKNGLAITKTRRGSQLVSAVIGRVLLGEAGLIVGGTTSQTSTSDRVTRMSIKVYLNDLDRPVREIIFYKGRPLAMTSWRFRRSIQSLDEWYGRIRAAIGNP